MGLGQLRSFLQDFRFAERDLQAPETPGRFSLRLWRLSSGAGLAAYWVSLSSHPCLPWCRRCHEQEGPCAPRALPRFSATTDPSVPLASSVDFPVDRFYHLPCFRRLRSGTRRASPVASRVLASMRSLPPRRSGPPRQPVCDGSCCLHLHGCRLGLRGYHVRGHLCVRLRYGLETRPHPEDEAVERLQKVGFPSPGSPSSRALAFPLGGFSPPEHASLCWTHNRACGFHRTRLNTFSPSLSHQEPFLLRASLPISSTPWEY